MKGLTINLDTKFRETIKLYESLIYMIRIKLTNKEGSGRL